VLLAMQLSQVQSRIRADPSAAEQLVTSASDELARSLTKLRELASGIHPSSLDHGLDVALEALCLRSAVPTTVSVEPGPRLPEPVAFAAYFVTGLRGLSDRVEALDGILHVGDRPTGGTVVAAELPLDR
jgi:signal transduction histidine kinase